MNEYPEQTVCGEYTAREKAKLVLSRALTVLLLLFAMWNLMSLFAGEGFNRMGLVLALLSMAGAFALYRAADRLYVEYDYLLTEDVLEVSAIYNFKRRKQRAHIELDTIDSCGPAVGNAYEAARRAQSAKPCACYVHAQGLYFVSYAQGNERRLALLELNEEMATGLKRSRRLRVGAWRDSEGKTY